MKYKFPCFLSVSKLHTFCLTLFLAGIFFIFSTHADPLQSPSPKKIYSYYSHASKGSVETNDLQTHYQITGGFFSKQKPVHLDIVTSCCDHFLNTKEQQGVTFTEWIGPEVIEIKHDNKTLDLSSHINLSLDGFCVTDDTEQLGILITEGGDAPAAIEQFRYLLLYNSNSQKFDRTRYDQVNRWDSETNEIVSLRNQASQQKNNNETENKLIDCPVNTSPLPATIGAFLPCTCNMTLIEETKSLEEILYSIEGSNDFIINSSNSLFEVAGDKPLYFSEVSDETVDQIKSYTQSEFVNSFSFEQISTKKMDMIIYSYWKPIYETHSRVLVKNKNDKAWKLIYSAYPNSEGFSPPIFSKVINAEQVELLMCTDGCDWNNAETSAKVVISTHSKQFYMNISSEIEVEEYRSAIDELIDTVHNKVH